MKKLAFALAMLIALTGCLFALASCGEEETSSTPAESSAAASETPAASSEEAPAASSEEAPAESSEEAPAESSEEGGDPVVADAKMFWVTHYNDGFQEGAGSIFTETDAAGGWWLHVAFKPVDGAENTYEITEITNGLADGSAATVSMPEGGFVWAANYGNDYPSINPGDPNAIDFTSDNCTNFINYATTWAVGDQFVIEGVDFENVPTSTPDVKWYEAEYICTATIAEVK